MNEIVADEHFQERTGTNGAQFLRQLKDFVR
jgi:hypothetical protein